VPKVAAAKAAHGFPHGADGQIPRRIRLGGGAMILVVIVSLLFGVNPLSLLGLADSVAPAPQSAQQPSPSRPSAPADQKADPALAFVQRILGDTEDVWGALFKNMGKRYDPPRLVVFSGTVSSVCGRASAAAGPFYCPADQKVYLDTAFFRELSQRFGAAGDMAQAYVIAHEIGHHVQNQMGTMQQFDQTAQRLDTRQRNALSVRLELQADCYAGVWGFYAAKRNLLEAGDVEEGLRAAAAVGDDSITKGRVTPDAFTHGTAQQRSRWFRQGLTSGDPRTCDTFSARDI